MTTLEATVESRTEQSSAGFGDTMNQVAKTAQTRNDDTRDLAGETTDPIREYLTAIGQHPLLDQSDEIRLGLAVERRMELRGLREEFAEKNSFQPSTTDLILDIYRALLERRSTLLTFTSVERRSSSAL